MLFRCALFPCSIVLAAKVEEPSFVKGLEAKELNEGDPDKIEAQVAGLPKPSIKW